MNKNEARYKRIVALKKKVLDYMKKKGILEVEIDWKKGTVLSLEPVRNCDRALFVDLWLKDELPTVKLEENMKLSFWYVQYFLDDFLEEVKINVEIDLYHTNLYS